VRAQRAVVLTDWNNTIIRLLPSAIVAKVGTSHFGDSELESLERELEVASHLAACAAPVIAPTRRVAAGPHHLQGLTMTLWQYERPVASAALVPSQMALALATVHWALAKYQGALPDFRLELDDARRCLDPERSVALAPADRRFLLGVVSEVDAALAELGGPRRPLHGSPHRANWLVSANGPLLLDFETACCGPVEWDLSALPDDALAFFPAADHELVATMRRMRSVCVAAKCWVAPERAPELREAARVHLNLLRGRPLD
jgi:Ser/Thr protein kinase RdoA (MazF antagonist)